MGGAGVGAGVRWLDGGIRGGGVIDAIGPVGDSVLVPAHRVALLVYPGFQSIDVAGPYEVFAGANGAVGRRVYDLSVVAAEPGPVRSESGLTVSADRAMSEVRAGQVDTLVVVGGNGVFDARADDSLIAWVRRIAVRAERVASVCSGTFVLAEAGLLDGRTVTTHWRRAHRLQDEYPAVRVDADPIHIRDGRVWTSAGVTAGIDLALAMVEEDHGAAAAQGVARMLVMFLRRPGGQSQFATGVWADATTDRPVRRVVDHVHEHPDADLSVPALARVAVMSERHFLRVFAREIGCTPAAYVERVRVEAARHLLETTDDGVEPVATRCGFGTAETMRRAFVRRLGVAPSDYRQRFAMSAAPSSPLSPTSPASPSRQEQMS